MAVHLMSGEVCWFCVHTGMSVYLVRVCVFWGHSCESVYFWANILCVPLGSSMYSISALKTFFLSFGCGASVSCMCLCGPRCPYVCSGFYEQVVWRLPMSYHSLRRVCVWKCLAHPSLCLWSACLCAPLRSACIWAPACARSRPRVPVSPARSPGAVSWSPVGIPACILMRLAGGLGAHTAAAGPTARQERGGGRGRRRRGARARHRDRQTGGRAGGGGRGFEPAPEPRGPLPLPAAWGAPAQPRSRQNAISRAGASRLGGLFRAGFGQKRGKQGGGPKTR